jgi:hypothetical protein
MTCLFNWLTKYEAVAVWIEGLALVGIFIWDRIDASAAHNETLEQHAIWRRQIHADRVAEIFTMIQDFLFTAGGHFLSEGFSYVKD